jgi:hypothetical protein
MQGFRKQQAPQKKSGSRSNLSRMPLFWFINRFF